MRQRREGTGVLFINQKNNDRQPDYTGELMLDRDYGRGTIIKIAAWKKATPKNHLISISISKPRDASEQYPKSTIVGDDVEIPF